MKNYLELIMTGGLGNQLFIAFEAYRQKRLGTTVVFNLSEYHRNGRTDRPFAVPKLLSNIETEFGFTDGTWAKIRLNILKVTQRILSKIVKVDMPGDVQVKISLLPFLQYGIGYFQKINDTTLDKLTLNDFRKAMISCQKVIKKNQLAIHIRRGDYLLKKHSMHGTISIEDLLREAQHATRINKYESATIFTDTPETSIIQQFTELNIPIHLDEGGDPASVMLRMISFEGIICSNSSFSLWAGLLGDPKYFSIPEKWMVKVNSSILGLNWIRRYPCTL